jgi:hypothetical protein
MKIKMTCKQIDEVNELLKDHGGSLTAFYDEAIYRGRVDGIIAGALVGLIVTNVCWIVKNIRNHKNTEEES